MQKIKVCAVDDDPAVLFLLKISLAHVDAHAEFTTFPHGGKAIDFLTENLNKADMLPDIILLDLNMPVMDGWFFLESFEKLSPSISKQIQIYIFSSSIRQSDINAARANKLVNGFISKPMMETTLHTILSSVNRNTNFFLA